MTLSKWVLSSLCYRVLTGAIGMILFTCMWLISVVTELQNYRPTNVSFSTDGDTGFIIKDPFNLASADRSKGCLQRKVQTSASQKTPVRYEMSGSRDTMTISLDLGHWTRLSADALPVPFLHPHLFT